MGDAFANSNNNNNNQSKISRTTSWDWIGYSLNAVDSGLQFYWNVRKRLYDDEDNSQKCTQQSQTKSSSWGNVSSFSNSSFSSNSSSPPSQTTWKISSNPKNKDYSSPPRRGSSPRQLHTIKEELECFNS